MTTVGKRSAWQTTLLIVGLAAVYALTGLLGLKLATHPGNVTAVWLPAGIAVAALLRLGRGLWPGITIGSFICNLVFFPSTQSLTAQVLGSLGIALASTAGLSLIAWLVHRFGTVEALSSPPAFVAFMAFALAGCVVNATGGLLVTSAVGDTAKADWAAFWITWLLGDFAGVILVGSMALGESAPRPRRIAECFSAFAFMLLVMQLVFSRPVPGLFGTTLPISWTVLLGAVWAGARLGGQAVAVMSLMTFLLMSWATMGGSGPFGPYPRDIGLLLADCVALLGTIIGLLLAAAEALARRRQLELSEERRHLEEKVKYRTEQLEVSTEALLNEAEERNRLAMRLFEAEKQDALGRLAGGVAHDFNNLLTVVSAEAELLRRDKSHGHDVHDAAGAILAASHRAAELTRQLLAVARRQPTTPRYVDVAESLAANRRLLRPLVPENVTLEVLCEEGCGVRVDPTMLDQLVLNLALNARDAIIGVGKVTITCARRQLDDAEAAARGLTPGAWIALEIADNGVGIPPELHTRIFEPFFTTKRDGRGTGLGLSTVWGIAKQARGTVTLVSSESGSAFTVWLPAAEKPQQTVEAPPPAPVTEAPRAVVLVVEDEALVRRTVVLALERAGHQVLTASDGEEALALLQQPSQQVQLVLTDVIMPRLGGVELAREVRARWPLPVLFMSGFHERHAELTQEVVLGKPFTTDQLLASVAQALRKT